MIFSNCFRASFFIWRFSFLFIVHYWHKSHFLEDITFSGCSLLTEMTIPSFITSIGESAFEKCSSSNQVSLQIPSSIKSNGDYTFNGCSSFKRFRIPSSLSSIGESDFKKGSSMTQITIPFSLISIKKNSMLIHHLNM